MANKKSSKEDIEKKEDVAQTFVYIGPTIPQLSILKHKLFKNGLSPECEKLISHIPGAKCLFVETSDFADAEKRLSDKTSVEYVRTRVSSSIMEIK